MIKISKKLPETGNAYILFGFEAIQARPNLDPYTSTLRMNDETQQVFTTDVHIKHHVRRGLKAYAKENSLPNSEVLVFYEKEDEHGNPCDFGKRLDMIRKAFDIKKTDKKDALRHCIDLPLFGYVHAISNENFSVTNAINTLYRPSTFHGCEIFSLGRNNAFPTLNNKGEVRAAAGSATVDSLEYGFFLSLWEINLNMLRINASEHKLIDWSKSGSCGWLEAFINGIWKAYSTDRYPSFTQRSQFAQFVTGWIPEGDVSYENPAELYCKLPSDKKELKTHEDAMEALPLVLPDFLKNWGYSQNSRFAIHKANNFNVEL